MNRPRRFLLGSWIVIVIAAAMALGVEAGAPSFSRDTLFWLIACFAGELLWVRLPLDGATISMAACFNFAALLVLPPASAIPVTATAALVAELAVMKKRPVRAAFNAGQTAIAVALAHAAFVALGGGGGTLLDQVSNLRLWPFMGAALAYYVVNRGAVAVAVALCQGVRFGESWRKNFGSGYDLLSAGASFSLGTLLAVHFAGIGMVGTLFVVLPLMLACDGYRRFTRDSGETKPDEENERRAA